MVKILYIGAIEDEWSKDIDAEIVRIEEKIDFSNFLAANDLKSYMFLITSANTFLLDGSIDIFTLREFEYDGYTQLLILNDAANIVETPSLEGIIFFNSFDEFKDFFKAQGLLKEEKVPAIESVKAAPGPEQNPEETKENKTDISQKPVRMPARNKKEKSAEIAKTKPEKTSIEFPKIVLPKPRLLKQENNESNLVALPGRQEIGFIGALRGVGTTFAAFYYALQCVGAKQKISLILRDEIEARVLRDFHKNIEVFVMADMRAAWHNDIIVYDFGVLDRGNQSMMKEFERCTKRYVVASISPIKKYGINAALQYADETTLDFTVLFNLAEDNQLKEIKKTFKGTFECDNLEYTII